MKHCAHKRRRLVRTYNIDAAGVAVGRRQVVLVWSNFINATRHVCPALRSTVDCDRCCRPTSSIQYVSSPPPHAQTHARTVLTMHCSNVKSPRATTLHLIEHAYIKSKTLHTHAHDDHAGGMFRKNTRTRYWGSVRKACAGARDSDATSPWQRVPNFRTFSPRRSFSRSPHIYVNSEKLAVCVETMRGALDCHMFAMYHI